MSRYIGTMRVSTYYSGDGLRPSAGEQRSERQDHGDHPERHAAVWEGAGGLVHRHGSGGPVVQPSRSRPCYNRVFGCARARAIELQTAVCAVGAVGEPLGHPVTDTGVGGATAFLPCDISVGLDGVFAALLPQPAAALTDPVLVVQDLPIGQCRGRWPSLTALPLGVIL